jgi:hypothetical protein
VAVLPPEKSAELLQHWALRREYLRDRDERRAEDEEQKVRQLKDDLALENLFGIGAALVRESQGALAAGSPALARKLCKLAVDLAPGLPAAHTCLARAALSEDPSAAKAAIAEWTAAARTAMDDPRISRALLADVGGIALIGVVAAGLAFVVLLFVRYAKLYVHDVHHLFPAGARRWQTNLLAAALILSPLLLQAGFVPLLFTLLFAVALYASTAEVVLACIVLAVVAATPIASENLARIASFGGPAADAWALEHGEGSFGELSRLQERLQGEKPDLAIAFALAHKAKREGDLRLAERLYRKALEIAQGSSPRALAALHNDLGNVLLLQNEPQKAVQQYQQALDQQESLAAPHFNLSRALGVGGLSTLEKVQAEQSRALEIDRAGIDAFTGGQLAVNRKANKLVIDVPLDDSLLDPLFEAEARAAAPVGDEVRGLLAGPVPTRFPPFLPLAAAALLVLLHAARGRVRPSGRCERCGREVCKRCDSDARPSEALCAQCVNVFVRRSRVDPTERVRKEVAVARYRRRRTVLLRVSNVLAGAGHVLLGHPLKGMVYLLLGAWLLASVAFWSGVARYPQAVREHISLFRVGVTVAAFLAIYGLCLRDLLAKQRAEGA